MVESVTPLINQNLKVLILLVYYERYRMVRNALESVRDQTYTNWELAFIDDGSIAEGKPIAEVMLKGLPNTIRYYNSHHTVKQKIEQGGSIHGKLMNDAVKDSDADIVVVLSDDDMLFLDYLENLNIWFSEHDAMYCFSHVKTYDPINGKPPESEIKVRKMSLNREAQWVN